MASQINVTNLNYNLFSPNHKLKRCRIFFESESNFISIFTSIRIKPYRINSFVDSRFFKKSILPTSGIQVHEPFMVSKKVSYQLILSILIYFSLLCELTIKPIRKTLKIIDVDYYYKRPESTRFCTYFRLF